MTAQHRAQAQLHLRRRRQGARVDQAAAFSAEDLAHDTKIELPQSAHGTSLPFVLWPAQREVLTTMERERLLVILKARQLGISWLACLYVLWLCVRHAGKTGLLISQGQLEANELIRRIRFLYMHYRGDGALPMLTTDNLTELAWGNGSRIKSLAATKRAGRSFSASVVVLDEFAFMQFGSDVFAAVKPTIDDGGQLFLISSADGNGTPFHRFWQAAEVGENGFTPIFLPWQAHPGRGSDWRAQRMQEAFAAGSSRADVLREYPDNPIEAFTHASGLVFDVWSDGPTDGNVTEAAEYVPDAGMVLWAVDDGYSGQLDQATGRFTADSHPRVFLLCQLRQDGRLCVFAEDYRVKTLSDQHIRDVLALPYPPPEFAAVDRSAAELRGRLHEAQLYTRKGPGDVEESIKELRAWIARDLNGVRRLLVHPRCKHFRSEMASYRYDQTTGRVVKQHDHGPDAIRGLTWSLRYERRSA